MQVRGCFPSSKINLPSPFARVRSDLLMRSKSSGFGHNPTFTLLIIAWALRYLFVSFMPAEARSADSYSWQNAAVWLSNGQNPYVQSSTLNWPPVWMQVIYLMDKVSLALNVPFVQVLRIVLTGFESLVIVALFKFIRQIAPQVNAFVPILLGIAVNPTAIFLNCQHGNFDVIIALWILLFIWQLVQYHRSRSETDWLAACFFLGLGIVTKTVPLVLCPMLAGGLRRVAPKTRWLGAALVFGPVILGMSVIYVLAPADITAKVLTYRSSSGWFGISGLLHLAGADSLIGLTNALFYLLLVTAEALVAWVFWKRERLEPREIILCAAMFLVAIPGVGPGFSPQYLYWSLPLLIAAYALCAKGMRWAVLAFGMVSALTCIVEYAIVPSHGMFLYYMIKEAGVTTLPPTLVRSINWFAMPLGEVVMRLPLFVTFLVLLATGIRLLVRTLANPAGAGEPAFKKGKTGK